MATTGTDSHAEGAIACQNVGEVTGFNCLPNEVVIDEGNVGSVSTRDGKWDLLLRVHTARGTFKRSMTESTKAPTGHSRVARL